MSHPQQENQKPYGIILDLMYRDGGNWKTSERYLLKNNLKSDNPEDMISEEAFMKALEEEFDWDSFIPAQYNLPSLAPLTYDWEPTDGENHCFMELTETEVVASKDQAGPFVEVIDDLDMVTFYEIIKQGGVEGFDEESRKAQINEIGSLIPEGFEMVSKDDPRFQISEEDALKILAEKSA